MFAPLIAPKVMYLTDSLGVRLGSLFSVLFFLSPSLICMGMVSPLIIQLINNQNGNAGKAAGTVYAISTVGGILATFLFGFYIIPELGITSSAYIAGGTLGFLSAIYFISTNQYKYLAAGVVFIFILFSFTLKPKVKTNVRIHYTSNGLFGQLIVMDYTEKEKDFTQTYRGLYLNGIKQTHTMVGYQPLSLWDYPYKIGMISSIKSPGDQALILGMGGGSILYDLVDLKFKVDVVELDERVPKVAKKYFNYVPSSSSLIIDDARHYIKKAEKKYDLVIFDILRGEEQPSHIFTLEGFEDLKKILNKDAIVIINFQGMMEKGDTSLGAKSVFKTLLASGFKVSYNQGNNEGVSNDVIFIASEKKYDFRTILNNPLYYARGRFKYEDLITEKEVDVSDAFLLTDDKPMLEKLNKPVILAWRQAMMKTTREMVESGERIY
jgi:predicted membrane-bound spermidine synthase